MNLTSKLGLTVFSLAFIACTSTSGDTAAENESDLTAPRACGGFPAIACDADELCAYTLGDACGAADALGTCHKRPTICAEIYHPVCGCDGKTYENPCSANAAGVGLLADAACAPPPPVECTREYLPVCGANGETYANACNARAAGIGVVAEGECKPAPPPVARRCGGHAAADGACGPRQFCDYALATMCGSGDQQGTCRLKPDVCTEEISEVCGCDGRTYSNACNAASAGVSVFSNARCDVDPAAE